MNGDISTVMVQELFYIGLKILKFSKIRVMLLNYILNKCDDLEKKLSLSIIKDVLAKTCLSHQ